MDSVDTRRRLFQHTTALSFFVLVCSACGLHDADTGQIDGPFGSDGSPGKGDWYDGWDGETTLVGGDEALPGEFDATVHLLVGCTGAKIGPHHILTAAHCVQTISSGRMHPGIRAEYRPGATIEITNEKVVDHRSSEVVTVYRTHVHPTWFGPCARGCPFSYSLMEPFAADVAVIEVEERLEEPYAVLDLTPVEDGDPLVKMGYGCERGLHGGQPYPPRLKIHHTNAVERENLPEERQGAYDSNLLTMGLFADEAEASLCPGDSGGPVYRDDGLMMHVVGVNAYYSFTIGNRTGISEVDVHARIGVDSRHHIDSWLRAVAPGANFRDPYCAAEDDGEPRPGEGQHGGQGLDADGANEAGGESDDEVDPLRDEVGSSTDNAFVCEYGVLEVLTPELPAEGLLLSGEGWSRFDFPVLRGGYIRAVMLEADVKEPEEGRVLFGVVAPSERQVVASDLEALSIRATQELRASDAYGMWSVAVRWERPEHEENPSQTDPDDVPLDTDLEAPLVESLRLLVWR